MKGSDIEALVQRVRELRSSEDAARLLDEVRSRRDQGTIGGQAATRLAQAIERRMDRQRSARALHQSPDRSGTEEGERFADLLRRVKERIETDEYAAGQQELLAGLERWSGRRAISEQAGKRVLDLVERFRADAGVSDRWMALLEAHEGANEEIACMLERLRARRANAEAAAGTTILSLGIHCLPWLLPNRWGLRTPEHLVTLDAPFNLAAHDLPTIVRLFANDFEGYAEPGNFALVTSARGESLPYNRLYRAVFNHHRSRYWTEDNFRRLSETLAGKVENVRAALQRENLVLLISNVPSELDDETTELLDRLMTNVARSAASTPLLIATTSRNFTRPPHVVALSPRSYFVSRPYPAPEYDWIHEKNTQRGRQFERSYVADVSAIMRQHGLWPAE